MVGSRVAGPALTESALLTHTREHRRETTRTGVVRRSRGPGADMIVTEPGSLTSYGATTRQACVCRNIP